jgi:hypothetical protein
MFSQDALVGDVQMKAWVSRQPALHFGDFGVLMGGVVIADQAKLQIGRDGLVDETEKLEPFLMTMPFLAQAKDLPVGRIQCGKHGGCAVRL